LRAARDLLRYSDPATAGMWPRAASYLARQALEQGLEEFWQLELLESSEPRPGLSCCVCGAAHAWNALSRACHHHPYELAPTEQELSNWIADVERVTVALSGQETGNRPPGEEAQD
jgi:hypothetical protein